jgi:beta-glucosidase
VWDEQEHTWVMPKGQHKVWVGRSSAPADLALAGVIQR